MQQTPYCIQLDTNEIALLPSFTFSHTLWATRKEPHWVKAKEAVTDLAKYGVSTTTQTLLNMMRRGDLHPRKNGPRQIYFDLFEVRDKFNVES